MATCELRISFDQMDRRYHASETVSGKVVVEVHKGFPGRDFRLNYGWRTHGWGNKDEGGKGFISLAPGNLEFCKGEIREFPFHVPAPCEPLTYHGHYLNVDWYLKASLDTQEFLHPTTHVEEDFLLIDRDMPVASMPAPAPEEAQNNSKIAAFLPFLAGIGWALWIGLMSLSHMTSVLILILGIAIPFALMIAWLFRRRIINSMLQRIIEVKEAQVNPSTIQPGDQASCHLQLQANTTVYLDHIAAVIRARESSISGSGTNVHSKEYTLYSKQTVKSYGQELTAGRWITFDCPVLIPTNGPLTFKASNNSIDWSIILKITYRRWPTWEKTIPITVVSRKA